MGTTFPTRFVVAETVTVAVAVAVVVVLELLMRWRDVVREDVGIAYEPCPMEYYPGPD